MDFRAAGAECCVAFLASCSGPERLGVPHSSVCLQNERKRLLWPTDTGSSRLQVRLDRARGNPVAESDETRLRSHVRMVAQLSLRMAHSTVAYYGKEKSVP